MVGVSAVAQPALAAPVPPFQALTIESPTPQAHTVFGEIVHTVGDLDHDGVKEVITTAEDTVKGVPGVGRVFVLDGRTGAVLLTLDDPEPQPHAGFGVSITGLGDVNGDGVTDIAVGAPFQSVYSGAGPSCDQPKPNGCNQNQGKMYVFSDHGVADFAAAAPGEDVNGVPTAGAAYVFAGKNGSVIRQIPNPRPETYPSASEAFFSMGLTNPGDVDGDHVDDLVVGCAGTTVDGNVGQGRSYLFSGRTGSCFAPSTIQSPKPTPTSAACTQIPTLRVTSTGTGYAISTWTRTARPPRACPMRLACDAPTEDLGELEQPRALPCGIEEHAEDLTIIIAPPEHQQRGRQAIALDRDEGDARMPHLAERRHVQADADSRADQAEHGQRVGRLLNLGGIQAAIVEHCHLTADEAGNGLVSQGYERLVRQLRERDLGTLGERVILGDDGDHRLFEQRLHLDRPSSHQPLREGQKADVESLVLQGVNLRGRRRRRDVQAHIGRVGQEAARHCGNDGVVGPERRADRETAELALSGETAAFNRPASLLDGESRLLNEYAARRGELDRAASAIEQRRAELAFEAADLLTEARLRDVEAMRRSAKVAFLGDRENVSEVAELDVDNPSL